jgi:hypothetical protein
VLDPPEYGTLANGLPLDSQARKKFGTRFVRQRRRVAVHGANGEKPPIR